MKQLTLTLASLFIFISCGSAEQTSEPQQSLSGVPYYRFWQGWKRSDLSDSQFFSRLASFMPKTPQTHAKNGLVGYTVGIPPRNSAQWIPDEIALVTYQSQEIYERAKRTPEGQVYANAHWDLFQRGPSKSSVPQRVNPRRMISMKIGHSYDVLSLPVDWKKGFTTFYMGIRRKGLSNQQYEAGMSRHVEGVKRGFYKMGMKGYLVLLTDRYEIAYQNWQSREAFERAMKSNTAKIITKDAKRFLKTFMFQPAQGYRGVAKTNSAINFTW